MALDVVENALLSHESQHPLPKTANPRVQIAGNFTPVPEQPVKYRLPVIGTILDCIQGVMFEMELTHFTNQSPVAISSTVTASFMRFTETNRLVQERDLGRPVFPKAIGELHGHSGIARLLLFYTRGLFGLVDPSHGTGVANAGLVSAGSYTHIQHTRLRIHRWKEK
ncbi:hypothetical protein J1N35_017208 [Gossypium stocksii]|uniref:Uncharacterized protein n=1 Tax=Gossypium stocksii TaxID=47602 RepID=A0A9D4A604_9ROSI|nr:hypothetical protein J1N35_017208 [Gossypium stocksii]